MNTWKLNIKYCTSPSIHSSSQPYKTRQTVTDYNYSNALLSEYVTIDSNHVRHYTHNTSLIPQSELHYQVQCYLRYWYQWNKITLDLFIFDHNHNTIKYKHQKFRLKSAMREDLASNLTLGPQQRMQVHVLHRHHTSRHTAECSASHLCGILESVACKWNDSTHKKTK